MNWQSKLKIFLSDFHLMKDTIGILACGSYITGNPTAHSDLDVHIILSENTTYRERGNKYVDGLLIEYFANPPQQILHYFKEDLADRSLMSQVQFATGEITFDKTSVAAELKRQATAMVAEFYETTAPKAISDLSKYFLWDNLDNLTDAYKTNRRDFDFLYYTCLDNLLATYMNTIGRPYNKMAILGNIADENVRRKYLLRILPDTAISAAIEAAITLTGKRERLAAYEKLTNIVLEKFGGFNIDGFRFRSELSPEVN